MVRLTWRARALVFGLGLAAASLPGGTLPVHADQTVSEIMTDFKFENPDVTVQVGETAHFALVNAGFLPHTMTIEDSPAVNILAAPAAPLISGESDTLDATFSAPGTYQFWCPVDGHRAQGMVGTITVRAATTAAPPAATAAPTPGPGPTAAPAPAAPAPRARDGQSLDTQTPATRALFVGTWGNQAGTEWVKEHEAALASQGR